MTSHENIQLSPTADSDDNEVLDPVNNLCHKSIQSNLDQLSKLGEDINQLESLITRKRCKYDILYSNAKSEIASLEKKLSAKEFQRAKHYFDLIQQKEQCKIELDSTVVQFKRALSIHESARCSLAEITLNLELQAESRCKEVGDGCVVQLDESLVKTLGNLNDNVGTTRDRVEVLNAEHARLANNLTNLTDRAEALRRNSFLIRLAVAKAEPLFRLKWNYERRLTMKRDRLVSLQRRRRELRLEYQAVMHSLETINGELHARRAEKHRDRNLLRTVVTASRQRSDSIESFEHGRFGSGAKSYDCLSLVSVSTMGSMDLPVTLEVCGRCENDLIYGGVDGCGDGGSGYNTDSDDRFVFDSAYSREEVVSLESKSDLFQHNATSSVSSAGSIVDRTVCSLGESPLSS